MDLCLLSVPYDSGARGLRMGRGPEHLLESGLAEHLRERGHGVEVEVVEVSLPPLTPELRIAQELNRRLAGSVIEARQWGCFPVVLAGSCYSSLGSVAGLRASRSGFSRRGPSRTGVVWFDSHGDFNTPETTRSGFLDGMALAMLTGRCLPEMAEGVPGFAPVEPEHVCLVAARDFDPLESELLAASPITLVPPERVGTDLGPAIESLAAKVDEVYLHLDLDALDPSEGQANALAAPGGLSLEVMRRAVRLVGSAAPVGAVALTAYDPDLDGEGRVRRAAFKLLEEALKAVD